MKSNTISWWHLHPHRAASILEKFDRFLRTSFVSTKTFKCFSVPELLNNQQHDIGVSGGTSVLLLEDDPACFLGGKGLAEKNF